ncbi:MAG: hypothetical protein ACK5LK_06925 [Chthoniobacterales bacterium]
MGLLRFVFKLLLFVVLTFAFMTLFQHGTSDFVANYKSEVENYIPLTKSTETPEMENSSTDSKPPIDSEAP